MNYKNPSSKLRLKTVLYSYFSNKKRHAKHALEHMPLLWSYSHILLENKKTIFLRYKFAFCDDIKCVLGKCTSQAHETALKTSIEYIQFFFFRIFEITHVYWVSLKILFLFVLYLWPGCLCLPFISVHCENKLLS